MKKHSIVIRAWQRGAGRPGVAFDQPAFERRLGRPIDLMLRTSDHKLARIVVVVNTDRRFPDFIGETVVHDGLTPTMRELKARFGDAIDVLADPEWGNNAGSASALNAGWRHAAHCADVSHILSWNPEMALTGHHVERMRHHVYEHNLEICGYLRRGYWERPVFHLFQNTAAMYSTSALKEAGGFDTRCDGNDGTTIDIDGLGRVTLAGMDDQDLLLRLTKARGEVPRIGMVGRRDPAQWQRHFPEEPERQKAFDIKIRRQYAVLRAWTHIHLPQMSLEDYLDLVFQAMFDGA